MRREVCDRETEARFVGKRVVIQGSSVMGTLERITVEHGTIVEAVVDGVVIKKPARIVAD